MSTDNSDEIQSLTLLGYVRKQDLNPLLDNSAPDGSHCYIGIDHCCNWTDDTPHEHLTPIFVLSSAKLGNWYEHHDSQYRCHLEPETSENRLAKAKEIINNLTHEEYESLRLFLRKIES